MVSNVLKALGAGMAETLQSITERANALKAAKRFAEAIALYAEGVRAYPSNAVAEHNLAGAYGDAGEAEQSLHHCRKAFEKGLDAPETWLVYARALQNLNRFDEARPAYEEVLKRNPMMLDAHYEWAQLEWMMTGEADAAQARLDAAITAMPDQPGLHYIKGRVLEFTRGEAASYQCFADALGRWPDDVGLMIPAANAAAQSGHAAEAVAIARKAVERAPQAFPAVEALCYASLAAGEPQRVLDAIQGWRVMRPNDQHAICLQATAWRMLDDPRYRELYDYEALVRPYEIATPKGWGSLDVYLSDLRAGLKEHHPYKTHPFGQSVRSGSQVPDILSVDHPAIRAFPDAIGPAIDAHLDYLGDGKDDVRRRNTRQWTFDGIWSVWLKPNGYHHNHVHPDGWLSSACYIQLPESVGESSQEGWIKFGEPGIRTEPPLAHEYAVQPKPGRLCLFPSYMWHGTIPFTGEDPRLTIAMDIVPT